MRLPTSLSSIGLLAIAAGRNVLAATGGSYCGRLVCTTATISGSDTIYTLNTTAQFSDFGWMAVGFGGSMVGSPMVIMWANDDGSVVVSQRQATSRSQPQVVASPPRVATLRSDLSSLTGSAISLSFSVPSSGQTSENMIYAFSRVKPNSNDVAANLVQHVDNGAFTLDLTQTVADLPGSGSGSATGTATGTATRSSATLAVPTQTGSSGSAPLSIPYSSNEKKLLAHGILSALGFCFFLPIGVLQARFLRIWWPKWFRAHWVVQAGLAGPFIVAGFALAVNVANDAGYRHFNDRHMILGLVLFLLYICQALYGLIIHLVKDPYRRRRPIQNYGHAILGLALIALSLYQVWLGFNYQWSYATGRDKPSDGVRIFWIVWIAVLGAAYVIGLALLPKQYKAERYAVQDGGKRSLSDDGLAARHT